MTHEEKLIPIPGADGPVWWERRPDEDAPAPSTHSPAAGRGFDRAALIVDTSARIGEPAFSVARDLLTVSGVPLESAYALRDPARLAGAVRRGLSEGHDLIIVGSGDASVSSVVGLLAGSGAVLGLLPLGAANDFARTLGIPLDLEGACETVARGRVVDAGLGLAGDECFLNVATVGLGAGVTEVLAPGLTSEGTPAYPRAAIKALLEQEPFSATLDFPNGDHCPVVLEHLVQVAVRTGRFWGPTGTASGTDGGTLDVQAVEAGMGIRRALCSLGGGEYFRDCCVHHWKTSRVRIETSSRLPIELDGESVARTPKPFSVAPPNTLKVLVPALPAPLSRNGAPRTCDPALNR